MKQIVLVLSLLFASLPAFAQDSFGSLTGQVTDPSGAVIPHVAVIVTDTNTGAVARVTTTGDGYYTAPGLQPGPYSIAVEAKGFKRFVQTGILLSTQQNATINIKLAVGTAEETVNVSSDAPLIDMADASVGQVLSTQEVQDLPSDGRSPLGFARIEDGVITKAKHDLAQGLPYNNSTVDDFSLGGGNSSSNELLLNGVPNMQDGGRTAGFSPMLDAVTEVRVDIFGANSTYGDTSGGTVNITTKSGTNKLHGSAIWFYQAAGCSSLDGAFVNRATNHCTWMSALPYTVSTSPTPSTHLNQYGGTIGGPFFIPKLFDGRNKLFFFYAYEGVVGQQPPAQTIGTVETAAERNGDFSALLPISAQYQLYNPFSATGTITSNTRTAIPNNCLVATCNGLPGAGLTLSPIAQAYMKYVPLPNYTGATTTAYGGNNYFTYTPSLSNYVSHQGRLDYNLSAKNKMWGEAHRSRYITSASNYFHNASTGTVSDQILAGGLVEDVHTFSPTLFLDVRGSVTRYDNSNYVSSTGISASSIGFPGYIAANSTSIALPQFTFTDATSPLSISNQPGAFENFDTVQLFATLTKIYGRHSFIIGADARAYKGSYLTPGAADGTFSFTNGAGGPMAPSNTAAEATFGSAFAEFDLGIPSGGSYNVTPPFQYDSWYNSVFLQDNWKLRPNVTIALGLRFEHETPVVESNNRMVNGFNPGFTNEATAAAEVAYAANPSSLLPAASFQPTGGATYATPSVRNAYGLANFYIDPRVGITWAPDFLKQKGVVRIGYGIYTNPFGDYNQGQSYGYATTTTYISTINGGLNYGSIADPFPVASNPIQKTTGNSLGGNVNLGSKMVYYSPVIKVPYSERASLDIQYQIGKTILIDLGYINNHQVHLSYSNAPDSIPLLPYLSRSPYYNIAATNLLGGTTYTGGPATTNIANPFKGLPGMTGTYATTSTLPPADFLMTNPEFTSVTEQLIPGSASNYNALNARIAKRMGHGLTANGVFEWSRQLGTFNQLNAGDILNYGETTSDYPFHVAAYGTYQLPFGHGQPFFSKNDLLNRFIGGWQTSLIYQFLSGMPISWGNAIYTGSGWNDFHNVQHSVANRTGGKIFNTSVFDTRVVANPALAANNDPLVAAYNPNIQPNGDNYRTFPAYLLRQDYTNNFDGNVQKQVQLYESVSLQLRLEAFNLLNRPQYNTPTVSPTSGSFGQTAGVYSGTQSRGLQVGAHIIW
jgi:Carboxypeptidase regulatory-like domain